MIVRQFFNVECKGILVALDEPPPDKPVEVGTVLRCGGLTWTVVELHAGPPGTQGVQLEGDTPIRPGMKLRRDQDPMQDEEYAFTQQRVMMLAAFAREIDAVGFLQRIETAHAAGPVLDPTSYKAAMGKLEVIAKSAQALLAFQRGLPTYSEARDADRWAHAVLEAAGRGGGPGREF